MFAAALAHAGAGKWTPTAKEDFSTPVDAHLPTWRDPSPLPSFKGDTAGHEFHGNQWTGGTSHEDAVARVSKDALSMQGDVAISFGPADNPMVANGAGLANIFAEQWVAAVGTQVSPKDLVTAFMGSTGATGGTCALTISEGKIHFTADKGTTVYGAPAVYVERTIDTNTKDVHHDLLMLEDGAQGGSAVKQMFAAVLPVYQAMGMKSISTQANLDVGGYAWAKYGFTQDHDHPDSPGKDFFSRTVGDRLSKLDTMHDEGDLHLSNKAVMELSDAMEAVKSYAGNPYESHLVSDLKTPNLDKEAHSYLKDLLPKLPGNVEPTVIKVALKGANWHAKLSFDDAVSMARLKKYIGPKA